MDIHLSHAPGVHITWNFSSLVTSEEEKIYSINYYWWKRKSSNLLEQIEKEDITINIKENDTTFKSKEFNLLLHTGHIMNCFIRLIPNEYNPSYEIQVIDIK